MIILGTIGMFVFGILLISLYLNGKETKKIILSSKGIYYYINQQLIIKENWNNIDDIKIVRNDQHFAYSVYINLKEPNFEIKIDIKTDVKKISLLKKILEFAQQYGVEIKDED